MHTGSGTVFEQEHLVIIGIDPGTIVTGYGVVKISGSDYSAIDYGCIKPPPQKKLSDRYLIIFEGIEELLARHKPHVVVLETQFVNKNPQSAIKLGMARGIAILAAKKASLPVFEYTPARAKKAIVGNGQASKQQVQWMIKTRLNLKELPTPQDAADALALALCHAQTSKIPTLQPKEI